MDELSTQELRGTAFAANLRRAFGAPVREDIPATFATLLHRLSEIDVPHPQRERDAHRLGA